VPREGVIAGVGVCWGWLSTDDGGRHTGPSVAKYCSGMENDREITVPADLMARQGWTDDTVLLVVGDQDGVRVVSQEGAMASIREKLRGANLIDELIAERRATAAAEDAEMGL
jgi:hypothetical protein